MLKMGFRRNFPRTGPLRRRRWWKSGGMLVLLPAFFALVDPVAGWAAGTPLPAPSVDPPGSTAQETAVLAGGCFWGIQAVFQHTAGVISATSGYSGGDEKSANYDVVSSGRSGHAEAVKVVFDPAQIRYGELLRVFFSVALDPTEVNRQGPDVGPQYRSEIFATTPQQKATASAYIAQLDSAKAFDKPIATKVSDLQAFYAAEDYHQDFAAKHPAHPYIVFHDKPKVAALKQEFPNVYREKPVLLGKN